MKISEILFEKKSCTNLFVFLLSVHFSDCFIQFFGSELKRTSSGELGDEEGIHTVPCGKATKPRLERVGMWKVEISRMNLPTAP
jgi:hypothetical protein